MDHIDFADYSDSPQHPHTPIATIEHDFSDSEHHSLHTSSGPDDAIFDAPSTHSSPHTSPHHSDDEISSLAASSRMPSYVTPNRPSSPYTPLTMRSPFRNPSSVRAIQLETTPPPFIMSPVSQRQAQLQEFRLGMGSRNSTPRSNRSGQSAMRSPSRLSVARKEKVRKEHPLVLLHVTVLPIGMPWSRESMESVLPEYVLEGVKLLGEKVTETVLERGILIPHPREDYELLEERLLESLELQVPRILKCGHFHLEEGGEEEEGYESDKDGDGNVCQDCGRRIWDGKTGSGVGKKRWDIKIYAANGLMRAGAWSAAWREMERVDVEIGVWIEEGMRRELEARREEEESRGCVPEAHEADQAHTERRTVDAERMREIYGDDAQAYVDGFAETEKVRSSTSTQKRHKGGEVSLWVLAGYYLQRMMQDRKNLAILLLSIVVLFLSVGRSAPPALSTTMAELTPAPVSSIVESITSCIPPKASFIADTASAEPSTSEAASTLASTLAAITASVGETQEAAMEAVAELLGD
ncbi:hypothetical protein MMC13_004842 [Lambiella insularis]|nr:hypothetical protein [Lambiella insularis]